MRNLGVPLNPTMDGFFLGLRLTTQLLSQCTENGVFLVPLTGGVRIGRTAYRIRSKVAEALAKQWVDEMKNQGEFPNLWDSSHRFGALFSLGVNIAMGGVVGISGIVCFIIGMSVPSQMGLSPEAVAEWTPSIERLPDAGRFMYRVDVTMDEPIKSAFFVDLRTFGNS